MHGISTQGFVSQHRSGLLLSIVVHGLLLAALGSQFELFSAKPLVSQLAIEAVVISDTVPQTARRPEPVPPPPEPDTRALEEEQQRREAEMQRKQEEAERQREEESQRLQLEEKQAAERAAAEKLRLEKEAAEQQAKKEAEARAAAERAEQERKAAEERARREQEQAAQAKADAERRERERRQAELAAAMAAEEELLAASQSGELAQYLALIQQKVERNWAPPASARAGLECEVAVVQLPSGEVVDAQTGRCNGDEAVRRSVENAVRRASPLPLPPNRALFERNLRFVFKPEQ